MTSGYKISHLNKGMDYHEIFSKSISHAVMWELEKAALDGLINRLYPSPPTLLDFACGTGRISAHLELRCASTLGLDVSSSMLEVARSHLKRTELLRADIVQENPLAHRKFNLITAFRFFPNAEPELRTAIIKRLTQHLDPSGYLVFNNHKNDTSLMLKAARMMGRGDPRNMSHHEVEALVNETGLKIRMAIPIGYLNWTDTWTIRPQSMAVAVERLLMKIPALRPLAQNVIYVCSL